jgi:hypothetical protein
MLGNLAGHPATAAADLADDRVPAGEGEDPYPDDRLHVAPSSQLVRDCLELRDLLGCVGVDRLKAGSRQRSGHQAYYSRL